MTKQRILQVTAGLLLAALIALGGGAWPVQGAVPAYVGYPSFFIADVVQGTSVTITPYNFPPNDTFTVTMNYYGSYGIGGYVVATVTTDASGNLSQTTFNIPAALATLDRIAIRLQSPTTGYYAYNWFWNASTGVTPTPSPWAGYSGYPSFFIADVVKDSTVTITPYNFTPNDTYLVRMNYYGTYGVAGVVVDTVTTDASGNLSKTTFDIPDSLKGQVRIAIRLESPHSGYYAYNWFWNNTTGGGGGGGPTPTPNPWAGYSGYPTFFIAAVQRDNSVTITPYHFTPNDTYVVRMNYYGTYGVAGVVVATVTTDASGNLSQTTFSIPTSLQGLDRIAIRLESPNSGYYAYNWFWNYDAP